MASKTLALTFTNPRDGKTYDADVGPEMQTHELVNNLIEVDFIQPAPPKQKYSFAIKRTGATIPADTSLEAAGVVDGDTLMITLVGGAGGVTNA